MKQLTREVEITCRRPTCGNVWYPPFGMKPVNHLATQNLSEWTANVIGPTTVGAWLARDRQRVE